VVKLGRYELLVSLEREPAEGERVVWSVETLAREEP
jgi:hypothetical protein